MNIKELKAEAKKLGLVGYSQLNKDDLEYLIAVSKQEVIEMSKEEFKSSLSSHGEVYGYDKKELVEMM